MDTEMLYVIYFAIGFVVIVSLFYFLTRKKITDQKGSIETIIKSLSKRLHFNKILLYVLGMYRLIELLIFVMRGKENELELYSRITIQGTLAIPFMIIGFLAFVSAIVGIFLSLFYMRKHTVVAKKLLLVSSGLLFVTLLWNYIVNFIVLLIF